MNGAAFGVDARQDHVRSRLERLANAPPQALILEGGRASERAAMARYFAARLNCRAEAPPCGACPVCTQILEGVHLDLIWFNGLDGWIKVDEVREVRRQAGEPPRGDGMRTVVFSEAQWLTTESANALLKTMEEPRPGNCFMLLAPQRERLFPTLVSRSWVLTLAWPAHDSPLPKISGPDDEDVEDAEEWVGGLMEFWSSGRGWFHRTSTRGRTTRLLAQHIILSLSRGLAQALSGRPASPIGAFLADNLDARALGRFDILLVESQKALVASVNPALVMDWLATRVYGWLRA